MKIISFSFYRLCKLEFADYVRGIKAIVDKYDAIALGIESMTSIILGKLALVDKLTVNERSHPLSKQIDQLRQKRDNFLSAILRQLASYELAGMESVENEVGIVKTFLNRMDDGRNTQG